MGLATINGLIFLTFFGATINALIAFLILKIKPLNFKFLALYSLLITVIVLGAWQISKFQLQKNAVVYNNLENSFKIASLSTNEKFNIQSFNEIKNELTKEEFDLLVLPEDILGSSFGIDFYQDLAKKLNINLLATFDTIQNKKKYNSSVLFDRKGEMVDIYNKNHLTFAGEYWPFGKWIPFYFEWLKKIEPGIQNYAVFDPQNPYYRGEKKNLTMEYGSRETVKFASLICLEIHYPEDLKKYRERGTRFVINPTSNRWLDLGLKHFLYLTNNLRKIEAIWLKMPIISSGVRDFAGIIRPDGKADLIDFEDKNQDYGLFRGEIRY